MNGAKCRQPTSPISRTARATLIAAAILAAAPLAGAQTTETAERGASVVPPAASTGRSIDAPRTRRWVRIDPTEEIRTVEIKPRGATDEARIGAFLQRNPDLARGVETSAPRVP